MLIQPREGEAPVKCSLPEVAEYIAQTSLIPFTDRSPNNEHHLKLSFFRGEGAELFRTDLQIRQGTGTLPTGKPQSASKPTSTVVSTAGPMEKTMEGLFLRHL